MALETIWSRCPPWLRAFLGSRQSMIVAAVVAVAVVAVVLTTRDKPSPKIAVGADTDQVLRDVCGYDAAEIAALRAANTLV